MSRVAKDVLLDELDLEAEQQFRKVIGYRELAKLVVAIDRETAATMPIPPPTEEAAIVLTA